MKEVIKLSAPITAHGVEVTQLELRRPTVVEVRQLKALPYKIDSDDSVSLDMDVAAKYIAVCGHIPPSSVNQLDISDLNTAAWVVARFFLTPASATLTA
ncbi:phage tail assembly protein [Pseudomonas sp. SWRI50]|uniref:phage tail assembly protein n=1 Tax=Pseudomonas sp. SWRI50 TaxID=2745484 RepID=UPI0016443A1B|nr:phage tail assembly protein [Pseudomonas sp. SWRI50]MBC3486724.1 phage tail assembly protein [Pseudomonas sp. SWRI50]